jgi:hypothetical protein
MLTMTGIKQFIDHRNCVSLIEKDERSATVFVALRFLRGAGIRREKAHWTPRTTEEHRLMKANTYLPMVVSVHVLVLLLLLGCSCSSQQQHFRQPKAAATSTSCKKLLSKTSTLSSSASLLTHDHWRPNEDHLDIRDLSCGSRSPPMLYTSDASMTVQYHPHVPEAELLEHVLRLRLYHGVNISTTATAASSTSQVLWHPELFIGYQLPGVGLRPETIALVRSFPGVKSVTRSRRITATPLSTSGMQRNAMPVPWGLDRLDQQHLPLSGTYNPAYNGTGVNVFVVDSGIDTTHVEFAPNAVFQRDVRNLYDRYVTVGADGDELQGVVSDNNDYVGHGTHCAGTIGGNTVGVSPGANIYGVKVLSKQGDGSDFDILSGLSFVYKWHKAAVAANKVGNTSSIIHHTASTIHIVHHTS